MSPPARPETIRPRDLLRPAASPARAALISHHVAAVAVGFVWAWHGLVPKLLGPHADEIALALDAGAPEGVAVPATLAAGVLELAFGLAFPWIARWRWPWWVTLAWAVVATVGVAITSPRFIAATFNPVSFHALLAGAAVVGLVTLGSRRQDSGDAASAA